MRTLAWDGVVVDLPGNWDLARYRYPGKGRVLLAVEDEYAGRMELDWMEAPTEAAGRRFTERATQALASLIRKADRQTAVKGLPPGWHATHCHFSEVLPVKRKRGLGIVAHDLITAIYAPEDRLFRCVLRLHFMPGDPESPIDLARAILASFRPPDPAARQILWQIFDLAWRLDAGFQLESTTFDIGAKLMVFRRDGRRLYLWTLSCADRLPVHGADAAEWVVGYLNGTRRVTGIVFKLEPSGGIGWKRRGLLSLMHRDELARRCFRYRVDYWLDKTRNQFVIRVCNYRREQDLDIFPTRNCSGTRKQGSGFRKNDGLERRFVRGADRFDASTKTFPGMNSCLNPEP